VLFLLYLLNVGGLHSGIRVSGLGGTIFAWRKQVRQLTYSWMRKWLDGLMDGWMVGRTDGRADEWTEVWLKGLMDLCTNGNMYTCKHSTISFFSTTFVWNIPYIAPMNSQSVAVELHAAINVCRHA
jgi:hypothetical protein